MLIFVYLVLASQYESFIIPLAVVLSLPAGVFGSLLLLKGMGLSNDIYAQIGLIMLIGLLGKNAVLIVEFAVQKPARFYGTGSCHRGRKSKVQTYSYDFLCFHCRAYSFGKATGAGAVGNKTIGSSALGGMLLGTLFGVIIVPGLYYIFGGLAEGRKLIEDEDQNPLTEDFVDQTKESYLVNKINVFKKLLKSINPKHDEAE